MKIPHRYRPLLASVLVLVLLYATAALRFGDQGFFTLQVFVNLLVDNSFLGIVAVGMTFVILSGGIDLSVGAIMSLASVLIGVLIMEYHWPPLLAIMAALLLGTLIGGGMGAVIHFVGIKPFIVTLAGMFFARGLGFIIHLESIGISHPAHARITALGIPLGTAGFLPITALVLLVVVIGGAYVAAYTPFGRAVYALGGSEETALLMGLPVGRTKIMVYGLSGFCAALAGAVLTFYLSSGTHIEGIGLELDAIAAVVIGGTLLTGGVGSVFGTLVGVLIVGIILNVITTYAAYDFSSGLTKVLIGILLLAFVLLQRLLTTIGSRAAARPAASAS
ncbi:MAG: sugar ABC transporter permease YjfF [Planctomycetes bacterium]|nr:sugar ABC transporter permease YjfF [Planctomycetota bacterium]